MTQNETNAKDIDLYSLLDDLWLKRRLILSVTTLFLISAVLFFWLMEKPKYLTTTIIIAPKASDIDQFKVTAARGKYIFSTSPKNWLLRVEKEINNSELLYIAYEWANNSATSALDWRLPVDMTHNDEDFYNDFINRVSTKVLGEELKIEFITDLPNSGIAISKKIVEWAQAKAFENLRADYLLALARYMESTNLSVAELWYTLGILGEKERAPVIAYDSKSMMALITELGLLSKALREVSKNHIEDIRLLPQVKVEELSKILPPFASSKPLRTDSIKHIASTTFSGFLIGILIAHVSLGRERNTYNKKVSIPPE